MNCVTGLANVQAFSFGLNQSIWIRLASLLEAPLSLTGKKLETFINYSENVGHIELFVEYCYKSFTCQNLPDK